jgi:hypothetical protein
LNLNEKEKKQELIKSWSLGLWQLCTQLDIQLDEGLRKELAKYNQDPKPNQSFRKENEKRFEEILHIGVLDDALLKRKAAIHFPLLNYDQRLSKDQIRIASEHLYMLESFLSPDVPVLISRKLLQLPKILVLPWDFHTCFADCVALIGVR